MTGIFRKFIISGIVATVMVSGSPASATYWWKWSGKVPTQSNPEEVCTKTIGALKYRAGALRNRINNRRGYRTVSQARYAYMYENHHRLWKKKFKKCMDLLGGSTPAAQSQQ